MVGRKARLGLIYASMVAAGAGLTTYALDNINNPPEIVSEVQVLEDRIKEIKGSVGSHVELSESVEDLPRYIVELDSLKNIPGVEEEVYGYKQKYNALLALGGALIVTPLAIIIATGKNAF